MAVTIQGKEEVMERNRLRAMVRKEHGLGVKHHVSAKEKNKGIQRQATCLCCGNLSDRCICSGVMSDRATKRFFSDRTKKKIVV
jgi:hypothetical protein